MLTAKKETFASLKEHWQNPALDFPSVFITPPFLESWWKEFRDKESELNILSIADNSHALGIAPLQVNNRVASFIGSKDVCDYLDFITLPGHESEFFNALLDELKASGVGELELGPVRHDSKVMRYLTDIAQKRGFGVSSAKEDVSLEMVLPDSPEGYFNTLDGRQRHELRRKLRRFNGAGKVEYKVLSDAHAIDESFNTFLALFRQSHGEKGTFMTEKMEGFFRTLVKNLSGAGLLRLGILSLAEKQVAMVMCFDYKEVIYLYNSAYEPSLGELSPGIASKAYYIFDSIEKHKKVFNFLKGSETYKYQMGGDEIPIYRCRITMK